MSPEELKLKFKNNYKTLQIYMNFVLEPPEEDEEAEP